MLLLCLELLEQKLYLTLWRLSHAIMWLHLTCLLLSLILRYFPKIFFTRQNLTRLASTFTSIHSKTNFANSHFNKFFQHIFNNIMSCLQNPCFNGTYSRRRVCDDAKVYGDAVLILLLMEHTLEALTKQIVQAMVLSLNPCFNGTYSRSIQRG